MKSITKFAICISARYKTTSKHKFKPRKTFGVKGSSNSIFYFTRLLFSLLMCMRLKKSRYPPMTSRVVVAKVVLDKPPWIKMPMSIFPFINLKVI